MYVFTYERFMNKHLISYILYLIMYRLVDLVVETELQLFSTRPRINNNFVLEIDISIIIHYANIFI